jgi:hypothetical protein
MSQSQVAAKKEGAQSPSKYVIMPSWKGKYQGSGKFPKSPKTSGGSPAGQWVSSKSTSSEFNSDDPSYRWDSFLSFANSKVFNGTCPVDFGYWSQTFQMECVAVGVWDLVKPPNGANQAMTAALNGTVGALEPAEIIAALVEDYFTHIKPPDATYTLTRNIMADRLDNLAEFYTERMHRVHDNVLGLPALEVNKLLATARRDWENERFKVEQSEADILHQLVAAITHYDRLKREHASQQAKCLKVFKECLGPAPKALIREEMLAGQFRSAYLTLYMHYNSGVGGVQSSIDLLKMIQNVPWEPTKMGVLEHIEKMDTLIALANSQGASVPERTRVATSLVLCRRHITRTSRRTWRRRSAGTTLFLG